MVSGKLLTGKQVKYNTMEYRMVPRLNTVYIEVDDQQHRIRLRLLDKPIRIWELIIILHKLGMEFDYTHPEDWVGVSYDFATAEDFMHMDLDRITISWSGVVRIPSRYVSVSPGQLMNYYHEWLRRVHIKRFACMYRHWMMVHSQELLGNFIYNSQYYSFMDDTEGMDHHIQIKSDDTILRTTNIRIYAFQMGQTYSAIFGNIHRMIHGRYNGFDNIVTEIIDSPGIYVNESSSGYDDWQYVVPELTEVGGFTNKSSAGYNHIDISESKPNPPIANIDVKYGDCADLQLYVRSCKTDDGIIEIIDENITKRRISDNLAFVTVYDVDDVKHRYVIDLSYGGLRHVVFHDDVRYLSDVFKRLDADLPLNNPPTEPIEIERMVV